MNHRGIASALISTVLAIAAATPAAAQSAAAWRRDIDELVRRVRITHPDPFIQVGELTFLRAAEALEYDLPGLSEEQRVVRAMRLIAMLGDNHSVVEPRTERFAKWYPLRIVEYPDGYFITSAHESIEELAGARVVSIADRPVAEVADAARDLLGSENEFWRRESLYALHNSGLMKGLGFADTETGNLRLRLQLTSGREVEREIVPRQRQEAFEPWHASLDWRFGRTEIGGPPVVPADEYVSAYSGLRSNEFFTLDRDRPAHLSLRTLNALSLPESDAYYIMINLWQGTREETIPGFFRRAMIEVDAQRPRRLILDLRLNVGGDGSTGLPVLRELISRQDDRPWDELYVLVSGRTYSASLLFLSSLVENVPVTLVGEPMGGSFNHFGDTSTFALEETGLELRVSALRHQRSETTDLRTFIPVDYPAPMTFEDYVAGRDPAIDPILRGEEVRSIPIVARAEAGRSARHVYLERRAQFEDVYYWAPPTEPELRRAGQELSSQGRTADAIETYRLSSEIHPDQWRSWYNLGAALRADGQTEEAISVFQRCVDLNDPTNFNQSYLNDLIVRLQTEQAESEGAAQ